MSQKTDHKLSNTTALAYMGDAVYEVYIRKYVLRYVPSRAYRMNRMAVPFVCADGQARAVREMMSEGFLTEEEIRLVKRARNHTSTAKPRGSSPVEYKWATGFEALVGALYLDGETERLEEVIAEAVRILGGHPESTGSDLQQEEREQE